MFLLVGEPQADVYFGCGMFMWFTDLYKYRYVELPTNKKATTRLQVYLQAVRNVRLFIYKPAQRQNTCTDGRTRYVYIQNI